jgi:hypothetical protein
MNITRREAPKIFSGKQDLMMNVESDQSGPIEMDDLSKSLSDS